MGDCSKQKSWFLETCCASVHLVFASTGALCERRPAPPGRGLMPRTQKSALGVPVLSDVSLSVTPCQFVGVIGPSGAGKSTLLDALCALRPADSGLVMIDGADLYANYEALREELG